MTKRNAHSKHYYAQNVTKRTNCVMFARCRVILNEVTRCYEMSHEVTSTYTRTHTRTHARTHAGTLLSLSSVRVLRHWGEMVHAIVVARPGQPVDEATLIAHCRGRIAGYKCPRSVEFRNEALPLSGAGKILKRELRAPYWEGRDRQVN